MEGHAGPKIVLTNTHNGRRPCGTYQEEIDKHLCQEVERQLRWIKAGPHQREMVWKIYFDCGICRGIIYTGMVKRVEEE